MYRLWKRIPELCGSKYGGKDDAKKVRTCAKLVFESHRFLSGHNPEGC